MKTRGPVLAEFARAHLRENLGGPRAMRPDAPWCHELAATFVTLRWPGGELQGCIGSLSAARGIVEDVASHAISAGFHDPRGKQLVLSDIDELDVEISLLSELEPIEFADEAGAMAAIRVGVDGIVLAHGSRRATLLPVMWTHLPGVEQFVGALKHKAGLPKGWWSPDVKMWRYTVERYVDIARRA